MATSRLLLLVTLFCNTFLSGVPSYEAHLCAKDLDVAIGAVFALAQQEWSYRLSVHPGYDSIAKILDQSQATIFFQMQPRIVFDAQQQAVDWIFKVRPRLDQIIEADVQTYRAEYVNFLIDVSAIALLLEAILSELFRSSCDMYAISEQSFTEGPIFSAPLSCALNCVNIS